MKIGILGAGRLGLALATRLVLAGHEVMVSNSRGRDAVAEIANAAGCLPDSAEEAAVHGDVAVISVPLRNFEHLLAWALAGRIVIDTCNYYPNRDGPRGDLERGEETTSGLLQKALPGARIVKAFNSVLAPHLAEGGRPTASGQRHALPIASDDRAAAEIVAALVSDAGFEPVFTGSIAESWRFERARPGYCRVLDASALRQALEQTTPSDFVPEGSWRDEPLPPLGVS
jgi:predicted dinucleotide-binding enzyme